MTGTLQEDVTAANAKVEVFMMGIKEKAALNHNFNLPQVYSHTYNVCTDFSQYVTCPIAKGPLKMTGSGKVCAKQLLLKPSLLGVFTLPSLTCCEPRRSFFQGSE